MMRNHNRNCATAVPPLALFWSVCTCLPTPNAPCQKVKTRLRDLAALNVQSDGKPRSIFNEDVAEMSRLFAPPSPPVARWQVQIVCSPAFLPRTLSLGQFRWTASRPVSECERVLTLMVTLNSGHAGRKGGREAQLTKSP